LNGLDKYRGPASISVLMGNLTYILPICLCCFAVFGADRSTLRDNAQSKEMIGKYKQHEGWVKLTAEIDRQTAIADKMRSQIRAQNEVIVAKQTAKKDTSADQARLNQLRKSIKPLDNNLVKMKDQRNLIEAEIRLRESNKK
jgi:hypothetical protein